MTQRGGGCTILFGKDPKHENVPAILFDVLTKANIKFSLSIDPYVEIWEKFVFISSFSLVGANYDKTIGEIMQSEELSSYTKKIMNEIVDIARIKQIPLSPSIIDDSLAKARSFPFETRTSFQRDYEIRNKRDERDLIGGAIIRMGGRFQTNTDTTKMIYDSLQRRKPIV
ncbi:MAG: ketopantoate reductase C-terminal domain-containing protein [Methanomassiliicoccales archaeon]